MNSRRTRSACRRSARERRRRNRRGALLGRHAFHGGAVAAIVDIAVQVHDAGAAEHLLDLRAAEARPQHPNEIVFLVRPRREVRVATLRRDRQQPPPVPVQRSLAKAGAGGDHGDVAVWVRHAGLQTRQVGALEHRNAIRDGLEVVQKCSAAGREAQPCFDGRGVDGPCRDSSAPRFGRYRTRDAERDACDLGRWRELIQERTQQRSDVGELARALHGSSRSARDAACRARTGPAASSCLRCRLRAAWYMCADCCG